MMPKRDIITIRVFTPKETQLFDKRIYTRGMMFGTIESIAKQYGIKLQECQGYIELSAPKSRLQMMVEKLHFASIRYCEV
jgi:hypothetical protein